MSRLLAVFALVAGVALFADTAASAAPARPASSWGCNHGVCIAVNGSGTHVDFAHGWLQNGYSPPCGYWMVFDFYRPNGINQTDIVPPVSGCVSTNEFDAWDTNWPAGTRVCVSYQHIPYSTAHWNGAYPCLRIG